MLCKKCGNQLSEKDVFCSKCGEKAYNTDSVQTMPQQGAVPSSHEKNQKSNSKLYLKIVVPTTIIALFIIVGIFAYPAMTTDSQSSYSVSKSSTESNSNSSETKSVYDNYADSSSSAKTITTEPPVQNETYTASSGKTFTIPPVGYAQLLMDGTEEIVPAAYDSHTPSKYWNYDRFIMISLDGASGASSKRNICYTLNTTVKSWSTGSSLYLDEMCNDMNNISVFGYYREYLSYVGTYSELLSSQLHQSKFDESELTVIDLNGSELKFYFILKISPDDSTHTFEGVGHVVLDDKRSDDSGVNTGGSFSGIDITPAPSFGGSEKCAVCQGTGMCSVCNGSGQTWGWKQKTRCTNCNGTGICPFCTNGYVTY